MPVDILKVIVTRAIKALVAAVVLAGFRMPIEALVAAVVLAAFGLSAYAIYAVLALAILIFRNQTAATDKNRRVGSPPMCYFKDSVKSRHFPPPWRAESDANDQALACIYSRANEAEAMQAKVLTEDEARRIAANIAKLPALLKRED